MSGPVATLRERVFRSLRARGDRARDARDWRRAAVEYRRALAADGTAWPIWVQLGHALKEAGQPARARHAYLQALKIQPATADTALHLGHLAKVAGDVDDARRWYARALVWPPGEVDAALELAGLGVEGAALEALIASTEPTYAPEGPAEHRREGPGSAATEIWARADAARDAREWTRAAAEYRRGLAADETAWPMWVQLGHALKESGDRHGALEAYRRALAIAPDVSDTALQLGHVSKLIGDMAGARQWYARALIWPPGELDAAIELSRLGVEGAALEALIADTEPHYYATPDPGPAAAPRMAWTLPPAADPASPDAVSAWLADIARGAGDTGVGDGDELIRWDEEGRAWRSEGGSSADGDSADFLVLMPGPAGLSLLQLAGYRTMALRRGAKIALALPSAGALLAPDHHDRLAGLLAAASVILTYAREDEATVRGRLNALGLRRPLLRLDLAPRGPNPGKAPKTPVRDIDILAPGVEPGGGGWSVPPDLQGGRRRLRIETPARGISAAGMDTLLARSRTLLAVPHAEALEVWLSRACEAGVPVMASIRGPAYRLFGPALADYIDLEEATDLSERWARMAPPSRSGEPDTPRWRQAIAQALSSEDARTWPSPLRSPPLASFGEFRALGDEDRGFLHCLGEGWVGFGARGGRLAGPATLRMRVPPHRSPVRLMVLFGSETAGARLRLTARAGAVTSRAVANLGARRWGWAAIALTPPVGPHAEIILDLAPADPATPLTIAGFAAYPEREDRYWYELLDRAARGQAPELWRATRRLASPTDD
jgi:tetratricopeptide (TPR) repeat protein